ncbi:MAG: RNA-binding protein [Alphaproteobacteria bacterium PA2]|nr:MAG: RNA-binding protein [Alphaproteobacteria bacterium PA2]
MTERSAYLDRGIGEDRGVILLDGRAERLLIRRQDEDIGLQVGARLAGRVRKVEPAFASAFLDLGEGREAMMAFKPDSRPVEGQMLDVEIRTAPRPGKLATVRVIGEEDGGPRLLAPALDLETLLCTLGKCDEVESGPEARRIADLAEAEALETVHPLAGGGSLAIEPTRALVAIDVDLGDRKGQDAKRISRQANMTALAESARLLRLKGLGGIVIIDLVGRGHDAHALLAAARLAFAPDNPGVSIGAVGRFGTMELLIPRRDRSVRDILLDEAGRMTDQTLALRLVRLAETEARMDPGGRLVAKAETGVASAAQEFFSSLREKVGSRVTLSPQDGWNRTLMQVAPA